MAQRATLRLNGYRELMRATAQADRESKRYVRETFREVGQIVQREATIRFSPVDWGSAIGYRTRVRQRGVAVEQSRKRTTGLRPDYGSLQMRRALLPALMANADTLERELERALDRVADHFNGAP
jgi:hypothetical protein